MTLGQEKYIENSEPALSSDGEGGLVSCDAGAITRASQWR